VSFRLVHKSVTLNDLERRNGPYFALFFLPNLVISGAYCVNVVDKATTMDNLRLLCLVLGAISLTVALYRLLLRARIVTTTRVAMPHASFAFLWRDE